MERKKKDGGKKEMKEKKTPGSIKTCALKILNQRLFSLLQTSPFLLDPHSVYINQKKKKSNKP
jgi:hypothetical protein